MISILNLLTPMDHILFSLNKINVCPKYRPLDDLHKLIQCMATYTVDVHLEHNTIVIHYDNV